MRGGIMGKIEIDLKKILEDLNHLDGFCRGYFKQQAHDYHRSIQQAKAIIEKEMEKKD